MGARSASGPQRLLVLDVEGTLFEAGVQLPGTSLSSTIWQAIASELGADAVAEEIETHARWSRGDYGSYLEWMKDTVEIHLRHGLTEELFTSLIGRAKYNAGVVETLRGVDRSVYEMVLVTGGFRELARRAQRDLLIPHAFAACEYLFGDDGYLAAYNLLPRTRTVDPLLTMRSDRQLPATHGNGFGLFLRFPSPPAFATGCHWLRPLGSINAPSSAARIPAEKGNSGPSRD